MGFGINDAALGFRFEGKALSGTQKVGCYQD